MSFIKKNEIFLLSVIVKKNFSSKYKDSVLGMVWTILSPLLMMALFTILFSTLFGKNIDNYPVYFLCGWCIYNFFSSSITISMNSLKGNKNILQKTPVPKYIFILGSIISEFLNFIIMLILLVVIMAITHSTFYVTIILFFIPIISLFIMVTGLGLVLSIVCVYYTDIQHLWSVLSMFLMYASGIFYPMSIIPNPYKQYLLLNPIYWVINQFRCFVYHGIIPQVDYMINLLLLSLIILIFGIIIFKKFENKITTKL